jgi:hypothetical protein
MNKRIQQLVEQAKEVSHWLDGGYTPVHRTNLEKFAKLMVKKFDDILVLEYLDCVGNRDKPAAERVEQLREKVKTYFGVEE